MRLALILALLWASCAAQSGDVFPCSAGEIPFGKGSSLRCVTSANATRDSLEFLEKNMPDFDKPNRQTLFNGGIAAATADISVDAKQKFPWAWDIEQDIFHDFVLPYANVNEARSSWRPFLLNALSPLVLNSSFVAKTKAQVATIVNAHMWHVLGRNGSSIHFKSEQTPLIYDPMSTIVYGYASCTGVSILFCGCSPCSWSAISNSWYTCMERKCERRES